MIPGTLYIISAASGTGKTSLVKALTETLPNIKVSISYTTRPLRNQEQNNKHYHFITHDEFTKLIKQQFFLEYALVFEHYYGTPYQWVKDQLATGNDVILTIDWQGAEQVKQLMDCTTISLLPPSLADLKHRLEERGSENAATLKSRLAAASMEINHHKTFDYAIINDKFTEALLDLQAIVRTNRLRLQKQLAKHKGLFCDLLGNNK